MTIEQYSRNVTNRLLGLDVIRSDDVSLDESTDGSKVADVPVGDWEEVEFSELRAFSLAWLQCALSTLEDNELSNGLLGWRVLWVDKFELGVADSVW